MSSQLCPYADMLHLIYSHIDPPIKQTQISVKAPIVRPFNKKTGIINFEKICQSLDRDLPDLKEFIEYELMAKSTLTPEGTLLINGKFRQLGIEKILVNYIISRVQCTSCQSLQTKLERDRESKLQSVRCLQCQSVRFMSKE